MYLSQERRTTQQAAGVGSLGSSMIDYALTRSAPFPHQIIDTRSVLEKPAYVLGLEMGLGKSRIVIDAACHLSREKKIDAVLVVCPAPARSVWLDPDPVLGEFVKWAWESVPYDLREYHAKKPLPSASSKLQVVVTNPEFVRRDERLKPLLAWVASRRVMLIVDESWQYQNPRSQQTKALVKLGRAARRVYLLNGTLGAYEHVYSQLQILPVNIFDCRNFFSWRARYCVLGGFQNKKIVSYQNTDDFDRRTAPYVVRRLTRDCLDLPPVSRTQIDARLTPETWAHYTAMRDELVTWLSQNEVCTAEQAGVRVMRLAQITAGFLGGVRATELQLLTDEIALPQDSLREIGREKLDALTEWLQSHWAEDKALIFTRFRADVERTASSLLEVYPSVKVSVIYGSQKPAEREAAKRLLAPGGDPAPAIVVGNAASGGAGLNFAASNLCVFLANDFSLKTRLQAEGRVDRPGQTRPVTYVDVIASGPNGEPTIDRTIVAALRRKQNLSDLTARAWRDLLQQEK